jgi:nucleoside-diphosphate-sugar epimerase
MAIELTSKQSIRKVCVTGSTGFLGAAIVAKLSKSDYQVLALSRKKIDNCQHSRESNITCISGNFHDWEMAIKQFEPDIIISCDWAGVGRADRNNTNQDLNVERVARLGKLAVKVKAKSFMTFGSQAETHPSEKKISENCLENPQNVYGSSKIRLKKILNDLFENTGTKFIWGRVFTIYGPGDRRMSILTECIKNELTHRKSIIRNPNLGWSFLYIDDFTEAIVTILCNYSQVDTVNIGNDESTILGAITKYMPKTSRENRNVSVMSDETSSRQSLMWIPETKTLSTLGWRPETSLEVGIQKTFDWWRIELQNS